MALINHGSTFLVCGRDASIDDGSLVLTATQGLFASDTRYLSRWHLRLEHHELVPLSQIDLSYRRARWEIAAPYVATGPNGIPTQVVITLDRAISAQRLHEDLRVRCFGEQTVTVVLTVEVRTDFADLLEVRFHQPQERLITRRWHEPHTLDIEYTRDTFFRGLRTHITNPGATYEEGKLHFPITLAPREVWHTCLVHDLLTRPNQVVPPSGCPLVADDDDAALAEHSWEGSVARINAIDPRFQAAIDHAIRDLGALRLFDPGDPAAPPIPAAGIPWFCTVFGRDPLLASLQSLPLGSSYALGSLERLAALQATEDDPERDAQPGKICHEMRYGEWAHFGQTPHRPSYVCADSTPLYLVLLGETYRWTGDAGRLRAFKAAAEGCLHWIDIHGDSDGDGFQEYGWRAPGDYLNRSWKDSPDGIPDERGERPRYPIATCELQAYVYAGKLGVADLFEAWGDPARAEALREQARTLSDQFANAFWVRGEQYVALALDAAKLPVETISSNPGHCLWMGLLHEDQAHKVMRRLLEPDMASGWGIRTMAATHPVYDPHAYHRGGVWPHDSIIAAAGMREYGWHEAAWKVIDGVIDAAASFPGSQLPEVFSGLGKDESPIPIRFRRANAPQAWSAGAVIHAVGTLLGLRPDAPRNRLYVDPALPEWCPELTITNLPVGGCRLAIRARRDSRGVSHAEVETLDGGGLEIIIGPRPARR